MRLAQRAFKVQGSKFKVQSSRFKAASKREESDARISYPEREQARPKVKV